MYKPVKFITEVPYKDFSTFYLFCKQLKILLPVEIDKNGKNSPTPSIYNTLKRILCGLKVSVSYIKIYQQYEDIFYAYLAIQKDGQIFEINVGLKDALEMSREMSIPIFVKDKILNSHGIEITKDIIIKSLQN